MKNWKKITAGILITITVFLIGYDIFIVLKQPSATISNIMMTTLWKFPIIIYAWMLLSGHFLSLIRTKKRYIKTLVIISSIMLIFSFLTVFNIVKLTALMLFIIALIGFITGSLCWSQRTK